MNVVDEAELTGLRVDRPLNGVAQPAESGANLGCEGEVELDHCPLLDPKPVFGGAALLPESAFGGLQRE